MKRIVLTNPNEVSNQYQAQGSWVTKAWVYGVPPQEVTTDALLCAAAK